MSRISGLNFRVLARTALAVLAAFSSGQQFGASRNVVRSQVFVAGQEAAIAGITTEWPSRNVRWVLQSEAGVIGAGMGRTDANGAISIPVELPSVTTPVRLALVFAPAEPDDAKSLIFEVWVLPAAPFAGVRQTLAEQNIVAAGPNTLIEALERNGLAVTPADFTTTASVTSEQVIILGKTPEVRGERLDKWLKDLPSGVRLIAIQDGDSEWLDVFQFLQPAPSPQKPQWIATHHAVLWTDLDPSWLTGGVCPSLQLTNANGLVSLSVLAGCYENGEAGYPLALEARDVGGRHLLIWNIPQRLEAGDPRWGLLLRNSLIWAWKQDSVALGE